jgi:hypothetical protein
VVATVAVYYPVGRFQFVNYDDDVYVTDNFHIKYGFDSDTVKWAFTTYHGANWHPLTWLSHTLDCSLFYLNPGRHHQVNVLLHAVNALLLFWVLMRATGYVGRSFMVAALFALHPINVESVAWVSERKNLLSMLFLLLALAAYRWYAEKPRVDRGAVVAALFALGLMAKPQIITFPFVLLLWDYWPLRRMFADHNEPPAAGAIPAKSFAWLLIEKIPLFLLAAASALVTMRAQVVNVNPYPFAVRLATAIVSYVWYLGKAIWPSHLAVLYPHTAGMPPVWQVLSAALCLLVITALVIAGARRHRYLVVGWLWFLGTLVPMIGLVQVGRQAMADRYAYVSLIGIFIIACWGLAELQASISGGAVPAASRRLRADSIGLAAVSVVVLLALAMVTHRQVSYWQDSYALWSRALQVTTGNDVAEGNLGLVLMDEGRLDEALPHLRAAVALVPSDSPANWNWLARTTLNLAICEHRRGDLRQAIQDYQKVITLSQNDPPEDSQWKYQVFKNMGLAYRDLGDMADSYAWLEQANLYAQKYKHK